MGETSACWTLKTHWLESIVLWLGSGPKNPVISFIPSNKLAHHLHVTQPTLAFPPLFPPATLLLKCMHQPAAPGTPALLVTLLACWWHLQPDWPFGQ